MKGPVGLLGFLAGSDGMHAPRPHENAPVPIVVRSDISDPGIAPYIDGTAAAELEVDGGGDTMPTVIGDILAGIDLVSRGIASRVTLTGFQVPADLARAADEVARVSGCQVLPMIGRGGTVALVVTGSEREGG